MTAAKSAGNHAVISRVLPQPICDFCIPVSKAKLSMDQWDACAPHRVYYGALELISYGAGDAGQLEFLWVPAMKDQWILSYVPLPTSYQSSWVYLCYCVEYWLAMWKCWDGESKKNQKQKNTKMQQERIVLEECMANGVNDGQIKSLDEFLIHNHQDWLFVEFNELPDNADKYLEANPLHMGNKKMFDMGCGINVDDISMMLGGTDNAWMSKGLDLSEMFKKEMDVALKQLKKGGEGIDIAYDANAELPDKWHEAHEPPIHCQIHLDEPLVFLYHCLWVEEEIKCEDFLKEIMDMMANNKTQHKWSSHVEQLIDGGMTWDGFSNLVTDELDLELDRQANTMGPDGHEEAPIGSDRLPEVMVTLPMTNHTDDIHKPSPGPSSVAQPIPPAKTVPSNMGMNQTETPSVQDTQGRRHGFIEALDEMDIHPNSPSDQISQFPAAPEEDSQMTSDDDSISESLFSLVNVQQAIRSYSHVSYPTIQTHIPSYSHAFQAYI
ncbi:uncharacterized protein BJ212DRAFT_1479582 [Suillus subaureus]|uniref:Uncharacterized protein n=1 Tax=Suillus subaureus TaxID=48587 RepID=A0A9P7ED96_9AGAM|nr:uncharacterized protein BJ212DRAFT_1479582 [Suillus subaureus]KAG1818576.1 hypothetical protein BJ212DRAFT_1479582 [Suillus subaureus]